MSKDNLTAVGCVLLAFGLRMTLLALAPPLPLFGDEKTYISLAQGSGEALDKLIFLPLWPWILSWMLKFSSSEFLCRSFVVLIGSFNCGLVYLLGSRMWNGKVGLGASLLMIFFPEHIFYSHFLYAEIGLEFLVLLSTYFLFRRSSNGTDVSLGYATLGLGMLYKHFIFLPFLAATIALTRHKILRGYKAFLLLFLFLLPVLLYGIHLKLSGRDPFVWINSPLRNMREWSHHQHTPGFDASRRFNPIKENLFLIYSQGIGFFARHTAMNIGKLWSPYSYPVLRLKWGHYEWSGQKIWMMGIMIYYVLVFMFGMAGLISCPNSLFRTYAIWLLTLLTGTGLFWYTTSRFRVPFLFIFGLFASRLFMEGKRETRPHCG